VITTKGKSYRMRKRGTNNEAPPQASQPEPAKPTKEAKTRVRRMLSRLIERPNSTGLLAEEFLNQGSAMPDASGRFNHDFFVSF
jgi:hypothetical protein